MANLCLNTIITAYTILNFVFYAVFEKKIFLIVWFLYLKSLKTLNKLKFVEEACCVR